MTAAILKLVDDITDPTRSVSRDRNIRALLAALELLVEVAEMAANICKADYGDSQFFMAQLAAKAAKALAAVKKV